MVLGHDRRNEKRTITSTSECRLDGKKHTACWSWRAKQRTESRAEATTSDRVVALEDGGKRKGRVRCKSKQELLMILNPTVVFSC